MDNLCSVRWDDDCSSRYGKEPTEERGLYALEQETDASMNDDPIIKEGIEKAAKLYALYHDLARAVAEELCMWAINTRHSHETDNIVEWALCQDRRVKIQQEIKAHLPF